VDKASTRYVAGQHLDPAASFLHLAQANKISRKQLKTSIERICLPIETSSSNSDSKPPEWTVRCFPSSNAILLIFHDLVLPPPLSGS